MGQLGFVALVATDHHRHGHLVMGPPLAALHLGHFSLRNGHDISSLSLGQSIPNYLQSGEGGVVARFVASAGDPVPVGDNFFETAPVGYRLPIWDDPARIDQPVHWQFGMRWSW